MGSRILLLSSLLAFAQPLAGQTLPGPRFDSGIDAGALWNRPSMPAVPKAPRPTDVRVSGPRSAPVLGTIGLVTGAAAFFGGFWLGATIENRFLPCSCDDPGIQGGLLGATVLPALAIPVAVHLTNGRQGSLTHTMLTSVALGAASLAAVKITKAPPVLYLVAPGISEIIGSIIAERSR